MSKTKAELELKIKELEQENAKLKSTILNADKIENPLPGDVFKDSEGDIVLYTVDYTTVVVKQNAEGLVGAATDPNEHPLKEYIGRIEDLFKL